VGNSIAYFLGFRLSIYLLIGLLLVRQKPCRTGSRGGIEREGFFDRPRRSSGRLACVQRRLDNARNGRKANPSGQKCLNCDFVGRI
jgi:hypothetical protein